MSILKQNLTGVETYFRNVSTGNPTLVHIHKEIGNGALCGFSCVFAQSIVADETDVFYDGQVCKKCLKIHNDKK